MKYLLGYEGKIPERIKMLGDGFVLCTYSETEGGCLVRNSSGLELHVRYPNSIEDVFSSSLKVLARNYGVDSLKGLNFVGVEEFDFGKCVDSVKVDFS